MEHMQNCKKWFELKIRLGKNCTIDKFNSERWPNICGMQAAMKPEPALEDALYYLSIWVKALRKTTKKCQDRWSPG
jgi:hypothetical protein